MRSQSVAMSHNTKKKVMSNGTKKGAAKRQTGAGRGLRCVAVTANAAGKQKKHKTLIPLLQSVNIKDLICPATFARLPRERQSFLLRLLPACDRSKLGATAEETESNVAPAFSNEYFNQAVTSFKDRIMRSDLTRSGYSKTTSTGAGAAKSRLDPWKARNFEPYWGFGKEEEPCEDEELSSLPSRSSSCSTSSSTAAATAAVSSSTAAATAAVQPPKSARRVAPLPRPVTIHAQTAASTSMSNGPLTIDISSDEDELTSSTSPSPAEPDFPKRAFVAERLSDTKLILRQESGASSSRSSTSATDFPPYRPIGRTNAPGTSGMRPILERFAAARRVGGVVRPSPPPLRPAPAPRLSGLRLLRALRPSPPILRPPTLRPLFPTPPSLTAVRNRLQQLTGRGAPVRPPPPIRNAVIRSVRPPVLAVERDDDCVVISEHRPPSTQRIVVRRSCGGAGRLNQTIEALHRRAAERQSNQ